MYQFNKNEFVWQQDHIIKNGCWTGYCVGIVKLVLVGHDTHAHTSMMCIEIFAMDSLFPLSISRSLLLNIHIKLDSYRILKRIDFSGFIDKTQSVHCTLYNRYMTSSCFTLSSMWIHTCLSLYSQQTGKNNCELFDWLFNSYVCVCAYVSVLKHEFFPLLLLPCFPYKRFVLFVSFHWIFSWLFSLETKRKKSCEFEKRHVM